MVYRGFKNWLEKDTHRDLPITTVELPLGRQWGAHLYVLYMCGKHGSETENEVIQRRLKSHLLAVVDFTVSHTIPDV